MPTLRLFILMVFLISAMVVNTWAFKPAMAAKIQPKPKALPVATIKPSVVPFPLLANYYLEPVISATDQANLAKYDVVILDKEVPRNYPKLIPTLRKKNPKIKIFVYIPVQHLSRELSRNDSKVQLTYQMSQAVKPTWYLRHGGGQRVSVWVNTEFINITSGWKEYLPKFISEKILSSGAWDGVFYDGIEEKISWIHPDIDIDNDGLTDDPDEIDWKWKQATVQFLKKSREVFGSKTLILGNSPQEFYATYLNGILLESFGNWPGYQWAENFARYQSAIQNTKAPHLLVVNGSSSDTGDRGDYRRVRYGLITTWLDDGYFSFDYGPTRHGQTWWYDEYSVKLGKPLGAAYRMKGNPEYKRIDYFNEGMDRHYLYRERADLPYPGQRVKGFEAIDGHSIMASAKGKKWTEFLRSDRQLLPLDNQKGYQVSFRYKVLSASQKGYFYFGTRSDERPGLGNRQLASWNGRAGAPGQINVYFTTQASDYYFYYGIKNDGSIVIDDITVSELPYGVWRRDFEGGTILLNTYSQAMDVDLGKNFYKITGKQDPKLNNGTRVKAIRMSPEDGMVLRNDESLPAKLTNK